MNKKIEESENKISDLDQEINKKIEEIKILKNKKLIDYNTLVYKNKEQLEGYNNNSQNRFFNNNIPGFNIGSDDDKKPHKTGSPGNK